MAKPNILFLFPDQHRKDWFPYPASLHKEWGMETPDLNLPNIEWLMQQGVTGCNAITPSPLCAPARACLAAGTRYQRCETMGNNEDYPLEKPTMYQAMRDAGYDVLGVGKFDLRKFTCDWFNAENQAKLGFTHAIDSEGKMDAVNHYVRYGGPRGPYMKYLHDLGENEAGVPYDELHVKDVYKRGKATHQTPMPDQFYCDNWIGQNAIDLISAVPEDKSWFMQVNFNGPHAPFDVTERMYDLVKGKHFAIGHNCLFEENAEQIRQCYAAMIENIDRNIGRILSLLKARGELENTLIVYASDHGDMLGDHGRYSKSVPFRGSIDIPFVAVLPERTRKGELEPAIIELQDLTATFVEMAGGKMDSAVDSISLLPLLRGETKTHRAVGYSALSTVGELGFKTVVTEDYKYIVYDDDSKVLFDRKNDVWEDHNIVDASPEAAAAMAALMAQNAQ